MNPNANAIAGRLSLRKPQRESLEILDRVIEIAPPAAEMALDDRLAAIRSEFPSVTDFEREFPSMCFTLPTGLRGYGRASQYDPAALAGGSS